MPEALRPVVYFSPVPWDSVTQRPHHFARWLLGRGVERVLWVEPYPTRLPGWQDWRRLGGDQTLPCATPAGLERLRIKALPVEPLPGLRALNERLLFRQAHAVVDRWLNQGAAVVVGRPSRFALEALKRHARAFALYDAMDDFPCFHHGVARRVLAETERHIAARAQALLVTSPRLTDKFAGHQCELVGNACDGDTLPAVLPLGKRRQEIAYLGTLASWFDWELTCRMARSLPEWRFALRGPAFSALPGGLPSNLEVLPACSHQQGMAWLTGARLGLIPFQRSELTTSVDPVKYYEYRALGLPILSTAFGTMSGRGALDGVFHVHGHADMHDVMRQALAFPAGDDADAFRRTQSWQARFDASRQLRTLLAV